MNQKTCLGTTYLDVAKGAVESFLKIRARDANVCRGDRHMLVTYDESTKSVKAGWRENLQVFLRELKNLHAHGLSNLGIALKTTFDLLNMHRLQSGVDNYGMGYNPFYLEPALVLLLSDGCSQLDVNGIISEISLPSHNLLPGGEITKEIYRWDQRLFSLNLKIPGFASLVLDKLSQIQSEDVSLSNLCDQTGGKLYNIGSYKSLMQSMESIAQKIMVPGVIINFEKSGPDPDPVAPTASDDSEEPWLFEDKRMNGDTEDDKEVIQKRLEMYSPLTERNINENTKGLVNGNINGKQHELNGEIKKEFLTNGYLEKEMDNSNKKGLLPTPNMPPMFPPSIPVIPQFKRGLLPTPPVGSIHGLVRPPVPPLAFTNHNQVVSNCENQIPPQIIAPNQMNGMLNEKEIMNVMKIKSEGQITSSGNLPENPIRGDTTPGVPISMNRSNVVSPNIQSPVSSTWHSQRRMIFVRSNIKGNVGHWPIPENFWPEAAMHKLPPRDCHPIVKFQCKASDAMVIDNMPFDKYELEPSPLTQYILERKQPFIAWQAFISGSSRDSELGYPFGYLKAATNLLCVNLFVLPYNYPVIMPLLDELFKIHKLKPSVKWKQAFDDYLRKLPSYYVGPLRNALRRMGAPSNLIPDHMDGSLSYTVVSYLKKVKQQAKNEAERLINLHSQPFTPPAFRVSLPQAPQLNDGKLKDFKDLLIRKNTQSNHRDKNQRKLKTDVDKKELLANKHLPPPAEKFQVRSYKNPFDIRRSDLINQIDRMRTNFYHSTVLCCRVRDEDSTHRISIATMGKYDDLTNQIRPLRELDQSQVKVHTFGNPFKLKQDQNVIFAVDEADVGENMQFGNQKVRKRPGEIINAMKGGKRKRSETPPPSRRACGPPNTPPPKSLQPPIPNIISNIIQDTDFRLKTMNKTEDTNIEEEEKVIKKDPDKKTYNSVNQQLRKLQLLHRNKKGSTTERNTNLTKEKTDETDPSSSSPILSILRTSLEDIDDRDNEEISNINTVNVNNNLVNPNSLKSPKKSSRSSSRTVSRADTVSTASSISFQDLLPEIKHKARLELLSRSVVKLRLALWRAIRARTEFPVIVNLVEHLNISVEGKYLFISNIIEEAERFQALELCEKLKTLLPQLQQDRNR